CPLPFCALPFVFLLNPDESADRYGIFAAGRTFEALHSAIVFLNNKVPRIASAWIYHSNHQAEP
ncbi:MAG: hypothetical protein ABIQ93_00745, partial [Saprospiraceae bacterium]